MIFVTRAPYNKWRKSFVAKAKSAELKANHAVELLRDEVDKYIKLSGAKLDRATGHPTGISEPVERTNVTGSAHFRKERALTISTPFNVAPDLSA